jgi:hypothetical protein
MRQSILIATVVLTPFISSCAGVGSGNRPRWINETFPFKMETAALKHCMVAVGSYEVGPQGSGFAVRQAETSGRGGLAQSIRTKVSDTLKRYAEEIQSRGGNIAEGTATQGTKAIADQVRFEGSQTYASYIDPDTDEAYALMFLCLRDEETKKIIESAVSNLGVSDDDRKEIRKRANDVLKGL